jgi:hypothetical protein
VIRRHVVALALCAASLTLPLAALASDTVEAGGVKLDTTAQVGGSKLQLNGYGVRYKAVFKVYAAGLYLNAKATTPEQVINSTGPRRMHIVMLREIDANELGKLFTKSMEQNASREEFSKIIPGVIKMGEIFAARKKLAPGEYFSVDYVPGQGTSIVVMGKPAAEPIKEPEFYTALMKIWLGKVPADAQLKDALLGQTKSSTKDPFN